MELLNRTVDAIFDGIKVSKETVELVSEEQLKKVLRLICSGSDDTDDLLLMALSVLYALQMVAKDTTDIEAVPIGVSHPVRRAVLRCMTDRAMGFAREVYAHYKSKIE
jgi:hypothetical protein